MNSTVRPRIYCLLLRFSILGWTVNNAMGSSKKMQNVKSLLGKRTLNIQIEYYAWNQGFIADYCVFQYSTGP